MAIAHRASILLAVSALGLAASSASSGAPAAADSACRPAVLWGVLPVWARGGFSDPKPRIPHVIGSSGKIAAILFGYPLQSPPGKQRSNKILWVSRAPTKPLSDLRISAQRMQGAQPVGAMVRRTVTGGPGPSIIDLPRAGCWRLTLRWSGRTDWLELNYGR